MFLSNPNVHFEQWRTEEDQEDENERARLRNGGAPFVKVRKGRQVKKELVEVANASRLVGKIDFHSQDDALEFCQQFDGKLYLNEENFLRVAVC